MNELDSGAEDLNSGSDQLNDATRTLSEKVNELDDGVGKLVDGALDLYSGLNTVTSKNDSLLTGARTAYEGLCTACEKVLNVQLSSNGMEAVTLTPSNYSEVLQEILLKMNADEVYLKAYQTAKQTVTEQVNEQADSLYSQVASQALLEQLIAQGYSQENASIYFQSEEGQLLVAQTVTGMSEEQKKQIRETYIEQKMSSEEVTSQITAATAKVSDAASQVAMLKGKLDSYGTFYSGLKEYTAAVSVATTGANTLKVNLDTLYSNTNLLKTSVNQLKEATESMYNGTSELKDGTSKFVDKTSDADAQVDEKIDSMLSSISGSGDETVSFVSEKNTNVDAVQFVIKTDSIQKVNTKVQTEATIQKVSFWQKLINLFTSF